MHPADPTRTPATGWPRAARRALRFAPVSGEPSTRLRLATAYFRFTGVVTLLVGTAFLAFNVASAAIAAAPLAVLLVGAAIVATGAGALWTANLLARRRRLGGLVAIVTLLVPAARLGLGDGAAVDAVFAVLGAVMIASVWRELD